MTIVPFVFLAQEKEIKWIIYIDSLMEVLVTIMLQIYLVNKNLEDYYFFGIRDAIEYAITVWIILRCMITIAIFAQEIIKIILRLIFQTKKTESPENIQEVEEEEQQYVREELPGTQVDIDPSDYRT